MFFDLPGGRRVRLSSRWSGHRQSYFERESRKWAREDARAKRLAASQAARVDALRQQAELMEHVNTCSVCESPQIGGGIVTFQEPGVSLRLIYGRDGQILGASSR
jgi:hypothetical protein